MIPHLSSDQLSEYILGQPSLLVARHVQDCPVCRADHSEYLFHNVGVRFVRCRTCSMVYVNPVTDAGSMARATGRMSSANHSRRSMYSLKSRGFGGASGRSF